MPENLVQTGTLILTQREVAALLDVDDCRMAVEEAFRRHGTGEARPPGLLGFHVEGGGFHIKVASYAHHQGEYFVAKTNANFPDNPRRRGLPTIQGVIQIFDARSGELRALLDSIEITILRTAAATAVAAKYLAPANARTLTIAGCGTQGRAHLLALARVRAFDRVLLWDVDSQAAERMAAEVGPNAVPCVVTRDLEAAVRTSDVVVTCTPSAHPLFAADAVAAGTFVAGVGADSEQKWELDPLLLARSKVVVDVMDQCAVIGDLHHALEAGVIRREDVHAELGQIVAGRKAGRTGDSETIVFDSTGMALQDAAAACVVVERAARTHAGQRLRLGSGKQPSASPPAA
jgi:alanine dehydrogenase